MEEDIKKNTLGELSRLLIMGEGIYYLRHVRDILTRADPGRLSEYLLAADHYLFKSVVYYLQLFKNLPAVRELINSSEFTLPALEKIVIYLHYNFLVHEKPIEDIFNVHFPFLTQEKYLQLLLEAKNVMRDHRLCLNIISRLDKEHLDRFVRQKENSIKFLGELIMKYPEEMLREFLYRNPELYGYLKLLYIYSPEKDAEITRVLLKFEKEIEEAMKTLILAKKFAEDAAPDAAGKSESAGKSDRIIGIINELKKIENVDRAIALFDEKGGFFDENEKQIVRNILVNPHFGYILDIMPVLPDADLDYFKGDDLLFF